MCVFFFFYYSVIFFIISVYRCEYEIEGRVCPDPKSCKLWKNFDLPLELKRNCFQIQYIIFNSKIYEKHILTRTFQAKGKFIHSLACPQELLNIALLTVESGLIRNYHETGGKQGKFLTTALGRFNKITGYFWGFHDKNIYRFDVNEI